MPKKTKFFVFSLLTSLLLIAALNCAITVKAQGQATVVVLDSVGGTVDPSGTNTYADGTVVTLTATPTDPSYVFVNWVISSGTSASTDTDNPLALPVTGGVTYAIQAVFQPLQSPISGGTLPSNLASAAIVVILPAAGGTTDPPAGRYALADATNMNIKATANSGWQFSHWIISGASTSHGGSPLNLEPTDNPYNVNHGYGYTYNYQAVFTQTGGTGPTPTGGATPTPSPGTMGGLTTDNWIEIALVAIIVVILIAFGVFASRRRK